MPSPPDVATTGWAGITVAVAWSLLARGVRVRPTVLRDARDHALFHLERHTSVAQAEDAAGTLTHKLVCRARRREPDDPWPQDGAMPLSPRWRRAIDTSLTPLTSAVFRQHYADGRSIEVLERTLQVDRIALEAARGGLREIVRTAALADGLPLDGWSNDRIDRLLCRLAAFSPWACPPLQQVFAGQHKEHQATCARCDRAVRLLKAEVLSADDLLPPTLGARPEHRARVLALHFHPEGRHHRQRLVDECDVPCFPVGDDLLLLDATRVEEVTALVVLAAEVGCPARDHLRGAVLEGPGRWSRHGLLGPLVERSREAVKSRAWGAVETLGELPAPLPEAPSPRRWWVATGALAFAAVFSLGAVLHPPPPAVDHPLAIDFTPGRGGIWTRFDVDDTATVSLVREVDGALDAVLLATGAVEKSRFAVGDGSYQLHTMGRGVLVVSSDGAVPGLDRMVEAASHADRPLDDLAARLRDAAPRADVRLHRRR